LAWNSVVPEYDPFKYNSFAINAGDQAYRLTLITNENRSSRKAVVIQKNAAGNTTTVLPLSSAWPVGVYSLSHVALPFAPDDPLYGGDEAGESPGIQIGNVVLKGEKGVLRIDPASLLRMHWNPFYDYLEERVMQFMQ